MPKIVDYSKREVTKRVGIYTHIYELVRIKVLIFPFRKIKSTIKK